MPFKTMIERWVLYGLATAICWGVYIVMVKGLGEEVSGEVRLFWMLPGIVVVGLLAFRSGKAIFHISPHRALILAIAGGMWAIGMFFAAKAIENGAEVSRLAPLYNTNVLISVILGIAILGEPITIRSFLGALFVLIGGILVSN